MVRSVSTIAMKYSLRFQPIVLCWGLICALPNMTGVRQICSIFATFVLINIGPTTSAVGPAYWNEGDTKPTLSSCLSRLSRGASGRAVRPDVGNELSLAADIMRKGVVRLRWDTCDMRHRN